MAASSITPRAPVEPVHPEPAGRERSGGRRRRDPRARPGGAVTDDDDEEADDSAPRPRSRLDVLV